MKTSFNLAALVVVFLGFGATSLAAENAKQPIKLPGGLPCLGCKPCPGNPSEMCDENNLKVAPSLGTGANTTIPPKNEYTANTSDGKHWTIGCNGKTYTYNGGADGLTTVVKGLCGKLNQ